MMAGLSRPPQTPASRNPPTLKKSTSGSSSGQKSIASFFQKRAVEGQHAKVAVPSTLPTISQKPNGIGKKPTFNKPARGSSQSLTPAASSDAIDREESEEPVQTKIENSVDDNGLPSPITPANEVTPKKPTTKPKSSPFMFDSPSRKVVTILPLL